MLSARASPAAAVTGTGTARHGPFGKLKFLISRTVLGACSAELLPSPAGRVIDRHAATAPHDLVAATATCGSVGLARLTSVGGYLGGLTQEERNRKHSEVHRNAMSPPAAA